MLGGHVSAGQDITFVLLVVALCLVGLAMLVYPWIQIYLMMKYPHRAKRMGAAAGIKALWYFGWAAVSGIAILSLLGFAVEQGMVALGLR